MIKCQKNLIYEDVLFRRRHVGRGGDTKRVGGEEGEEEEEFTTMYNKTAMMAIQSCLFTVQPVIIGIQL